MPFTFKETDLEDVTLVEPTVFEDERGSLVETYLERGFQDNGIGNSFIQDKVTVSDENVVRGLHFQEGPAAQAKLVRCSRGQIFDAVVDLRRDSESYGRHETFRVSGDDHRMIFVPRGCAHGYLTERSKTRVHYKIDNDYAPDTERGIAWDDPRLGIDWPTTDPTLSDKDQDWPTLSEAEQRGILYDHTPQ